MNREKRKRLRELDARLRAVLAEVKTLKFEESYDYRSRCPNGVNHYPVSWSILNRAEENLKACIVEIGRAEQASPGWTLSVYDAKRPIKV